jgi:hypothetical protein
VERLLTRTVFLLAFVACGGSNLSEKRQPGTQTTATSSGVPGTPGPLGCIEDPAAKQACAGKGDAWQYSYPAPRHCSGVDVQDEPPEPTPACECIESSEYARLQRECAEVP